MDAATLALIEEIISVLVQAVKLGIQYGPEIIAGLEQTFQLVFSGTTLTDDQKASAEQSVQAAHAAIQAKVAADMAAAGVDPTTGQAVS